MRSIVRVRGRNMDCAMESCGFMYTRGDAPVARWSDLRRRTNMNVVDVGHPHDRRGASPASRRDPPCRRGAVGRARDNALSSRPRAGFDLEQELRCDEGDRRSRSGGPDELAGS
jgi:hypothetical protein